MKNECLSTEYYENFDINVFSKKIDVIRSKLETLKRERGKKVYYTELYATYLQIVEIFCINSFAISEKDLLNNIFLSTSEIHEKINSRFYNEKNEKGQSFIEYLVNEFVFNLIVDAKNRDEQKRTYNRLTKEALDDYLKDKDFLNSYKHGFRVFSGEKATLSVGIAGSKSSDNVADYTSSVSYYCRNRETKEILKCSIYFNWERVYAKSRVLLNTLKNMRRTYLHGKDERIEFLTFDNEIINRNYGCFRICHVVE